MTMTSWFSDMVPASYFFNGLLFLLSSLATGPGFMSISLMVLELWQFSFIKDWPEIRKSKIPPSGLNIWRLGQVGNNKFDTNVSNKMLLNAAKSQGCSICRFEVIKGKPTRGRGVKLSPTHIRVNRINQTYNLNVLIWKRRSKVKCSSY